MSFANQEAKLDTGVTHICSLIACRGQRSCSGGNIVTRHPSYNLVIASNCRRAGVTLHAAEKALDPRNALDWHNRLDVVATQTYVRQLGLLCTWSTRVSGS